MRLSEVLREEAILLDLDKVDKWRAVELLTDALVASGQVDASLKQTTLDGLVAREKSMSTGMENGVAIPHCSIEAIENTLVSIGISRDGIEFDSIDGSPTHLIILLVTPKDKTRVHIKTLAEIAKLLNSDQYRNRLLNVTDTKSVLDITRDEEGGLIP